MQRIELSKEWFAGAELLTGASASTPEGRAYAVTLWLRKVAGLKLAKITADDLARLPDPKYVAELAATEVRKIRRRSGSPQDFERRLNTKISTVLHQLPATARVAFATWLACAPLQSAVPSSPTEPPLLKPVDAAPSQPPSSAEATAPAIPAASLSRVAEFERQVRKSVADGLLPASLLATAMEPVDATLSRRRLALHGLGAR